MNPLLEGGDPTPFAAVRPEHAKPAIVELLAAAEAALEKAVSPDVPADWDALALVLDVPVERLFRAWSHVNHLQNVVHTPELRAAHGECLPLVIDFSTRLNADARLYAKYKAIAASPAAERLHPAQRKALSDALRDFVLGGAELQGPARERFAAIQDRAGALSQKFGENVLDATDTFTLDVPESRLAGVPEDVLTAVREAAAAAGVAGCRLTLRAPCYTPVMQFAADRALREQLFRAWATRASELGDAARDNGPLMAELLALRAEEAALLGYPTYAHAALVAWA
jgi:oligopeptidase A